MVLKRLREETRGHHERVERRFDLEKRLGDVGKYRELLERLLGIYGALEAGLQGLDWKSAGIDFDERRKVGLLKADLRALGVQAERIEEMARGKVVEPVGELALGFGQLYVLEGATLGGQVICPMVEQRLGLGVRTGASFFASYGEGVGRMWKGFCGAIRGQCVSDAEVAAAVEGAVRAFSCFEGALAG